MSKYKIPVAIAEQDIKMRYDGKACDAMIKLANLLKLVNHSK